MISLFCSQLAQDRTCQFSDCITNGLPEQMPLCKNPPVHSGRTDCSRNASCLTGKSCGKGKPGGAAALANQPVTPARPMASFLKFPLDLKKIRPIAGNG
jgi:hypothetical protein